MSLSYRDGAFAIIGSVGYWDLALSFRWDIANADEYSDIGGTSADDEAVPIDKTYLLSFYPDLIVLYVCIC